jgi:hypothetical protein
MRPHQVTANRHTNEINPIAHHPRECSTLCLVMLWELMAKDPIPYMTAPMGDIRSISIASIPKTSKLDNQSIAVFPEKEHRCIRATAARRHTVYSWFAAHARKITAPARGWLLLT